MCGNVRSSRGHLAEETGALALLDGSSGGSGSGGSSRRGSVMLLGVSSGRVRLLLAVGRGGSRSGGSSGRAGGSAARGSRGGTTALTRHFVWFCERV